MESEAKVFKKKKQGIFPMGSMNLTQNADPLIASNALLQVRKAELM